MPITPQLDDFRCWQRAPDAYYGKPGAQSRDEQESLMYRHDARQAEWFYRFLGSLFGTL